MTRTKISCLFAKFNIDYCGRWLDHTFVSFISLEC